jgi:hypothetical protein
MKMVSLTETTAVPHCRYDPVNGMWPKALPPCTRHEATLASRKLAKHFGIRSRRVRACWVTRQENSRHKGWWRIAHDLSHRWFTQTYPNKRPHDPLHARYEAQVIAYILEKGWLDGRLKERPKKKKPVTAETKHAMVLASIKRWETKAKRAETALKKLRARKRYYEKRLTS